MRILAPAKINLALHVTGRRDDGYHDLSSLVAFSDWGDELIVQESKKDHIRFVGEFAQGLNPDQNSLLNAMAWFRSQTGISDHFEVKVQKNIPHGAGLGGGTADAAAILRALYQIYDLPLPQPHITRELGADVPVSFQNAPMLMEGVGEELRPIQLDADYWVLLANPRETLSTARVFSMMTEFHPKITHQTHYSIEDLNQLENNMTPAAAKICTAISGLIAMIDQSGAVLTRMSGSGSTVFGLFSDPLIAKRGAKTLQASHPEYWFQTAQISRSTT